MYPLDKVYGKYTYDAWNESKPDDLSHTKRSPSQAKHDIWEVDSYKRLLECVAFLGSMNKRHVLFYRGQSREFGDNLLPTLYRDSPFQASMSGFELTLNNHNRQFIWQALEEIGKKVFAICLDKDKFGLPRRRGLEKIREVQWAVIQHYELWPTPLVDITSSLRCGASFALGSGCRKEGFLYVVGLPNSTGSVSFDVDQHIVLARLQSVCLPAAIRPHYQDGFLVGRFPMYSAADGAGGKSDLSKRLIAKFKLIDNGSFWDNDFTVMSKNATYPDDKLLHAFKTDMSEGLCNLAEQARDLKTASVVSPW